MTTIAAIQAGLPTPAGIAAISPFTDADPARKLKHRNARRCSMFTRGAVSECTQYLGEARGPQGHGGRHAAAESAVDDELWAVSAAQLESIKKQRASPDGTPT